MRIDTTKEGLRKIFKLNDGFTSELGYVSEKEDEDRYYSIKDGQLIRRSVARDSSYDKTVMCNHSEATTFVVWNVNKLKFE